MELTSSFLFGVCISVLYLIRSLAAASVERFVGPVELWPGWAWDVFGPWLPRSVRLAIAFGFGAALVLFAIGRAARSSRFSVAGLHAVFWMLAFITLGLILFTRDLMLAPPVSGKMVPVTPEYEHAQQLEAYWFWSLLVIMLLACFSVFRSIFAQKHSTHDVA